MQEESQVIVGIKSYQGTPHDSKTLSESLEQVESLTGKRYERVIVDRGYRGVDKLIEEEVILPGSRKLEKGSYAYGKHKGRCRKRAAIEGLISHVKNYYKLGRNFLRGKQGDVFNSLLVAAGHNLHLLLVEMSKKVYFFLFKLVGPLYKRIYPNNQPFSFWPILNF